MTNFIDMNKLLLFTCFQLISILAVSQSSLLDEYINIGVENNLALKQKQVDFDIASKSLKEAKGLFFPEVSVSARYTVATGGRVIEFPIGDLLNPVYGSLNKLMQLAPANQFPMLENQSIPFLRGHEQDTKLSLIQPVFNAQLNANYKLKQEQLKISQSQVQQYKNEVSFEIKKAYFNYLKTLEIVDLIEKTSALINENLRVNEKLFNNNMATKDVVLRAQTEISKLNMQLNEALKNRQMAKAYFNFLLNRQLEDEIKTEPMNITNEIPAEDLLLQIAYRNREELKQLTHGTNAYSQMAKINSAENLPSVFLAADYGFQGEEYSFTQKDDYAMVTVGLKWTLLKGAANKAKRDQALLHKEHTLLKKQEVQKLIELEIREGVLNLEQQLKNLNVAQKQVVEANEVYRMLEKKYKNGTASQIELLDAQNVKIQSELNSILTQYDLMNSKANLEKIVGAKM